MHGTFKRWESQFFFHPRPTMRWQHHATANLSATNTSGITCTSAMIGDTLHQYVWCIPKMIHHCGTQAWCGLPRIYACSLDVLPDVHPAMMFRSYFVQPQPQILTSASDVLPRDQMILHMFGHFLSGWCLNPCLELEWTIVWFLSTGNVGGGLPSSTIQLF